MNRPAPATAQGARYEMFFREVSEIIEAARRSAARSVNAVMTAAYWLIGRHIAELEQEGRSRAEYGKETVERLAADLSARYGRGFSVRNVWLMRAFYLGWPIAQTPSAESLLDTIRSRFPLPWSAYVRLLSVRNEHARAFYEAEALRGGWTVRQLDRQINTQFCERTALSKNKAALLAEGGKVGAADRTLPENEIKDPFVLELALGEGLTIEFKRSFRTDLGREICAFANATGGAILLGVEDDGRVCGVQGHNRLKSRVQSIARSAEPSIGVDVESMGELCVRVPAQSGKPYSFGGRFFVREGASPHQMSRDEIRELFYAEGVIRFDETPCRRFSLDSDLDEETWARFRRRAKIPDHMEPRTALEDLDLLAADGRITSAGAWLLAKDIRKFHSSAHLSCALFQGTTKTEILDRRDFASDVYSTIDGAMTWVGSKINVRYIITGSVNREERPELPFGRDPRGGGQRRRPQGLPFHGQRPRLPVS